MKTIYFNFAKMLCAFLFALTSFLTASAGDHEGRYYDEENWVTFEGFVYELNYDEDSGNSTATLIGRDWYIDSISGEIIDCPILYEGWNIDSVLFLPPFILFNTPVTAIKGGFAGYTDIKTVDVPYTVTSIHRGAFAHSSLETIIFDYDGDYNSTPPISFGEYETPSSSYTKSRGEFMNCKRLTTVKFHRPLKNIPCFMFYNCPKLESIDFDDYYFDTDEIIIDSIGNGAFEHCNSLKSLKIPHGVTSSIGDYAFAECHQLEEISINPSLQSIGKAAFCNCRSLTSISIPDAITSIKDYTFYDCQSLTNINLNNVTTIGEHAFAGCNKLPSIDLTKAQSIGKVAFMGGKVFCSIWIDVYQPDIQRIAYQEERASINLGSLKKITIGEGVSELNEWTFGGHVPDTIVCMAHVPPIYTDTNTYELTFSPEAYETSILFVPKILVNDYREAFGWKKFVHIDGITIQGNGDVNGDGRISISDVTALIDKILDSQGASINLINADVNGDGKLSIGDVTDLINLLLNAN